MLRLGLVCGRPTIARCRLVKHPTGAASRPVDATLQATVAPTSPHSVALVATPQLAFSSTLGASFVVALLSRAATPVVLSARTPSRPVSATFQAKMVAPTRFTAGLLSLLLSLPTLAEERRLQGDDGGTG